FKKLMFSILKLPTVSMKSFCDINSSRRELASETFQFGFQFASPLLRRLPSPGRLGCFGFRCGPGTPERAAGRGGVGSILPGGSCGRIARPIGGARFACGRWFGSIRLSRAGDPLARGGCGRRIVFGRF
ncbi:MAG TPA: hypothetical protein PJ994_02930, partial [Tepidiformaceae bacterium]|nr:hypothetical protein [Tepidiformaceae bacterium]